MKSLPVPSCLCLRSNPGQCRIHRRHFFCSQGRGGETLGLIGVDTVKSLLLAVLVNVRPNQSSNRRKNTSLHKIKKRPLCALNRVLAKHVVEHVVGLDLRNPRPITSLHHNVKLNASSLRNVELHTHE